MLGLRLAVLFASILTSVACLAQQIPAGTILPVELETSLKSSRMRPGEVVKARVMQDVPLGLNSKVRAGSKVLGRVVSLAGRRAKRQNFR